MNELDCLRLLVAELVGLDANGVPNFTPPGGPGADQDVNLVSVGGAAVALGTGTPAQSLLTVPAKWVRHSANLSASGTQAIPDGALYSYSIITGTGGDGTMTGLPAGYSDWSTVPIATGFTLTMDNPGTAKVVWFTAT